MPWRATRLWNFGGDQTLACAVHRCLLGLAMMLLQKNATVTICHSRTKNLPDIIAQADILVGAVGKPEFIKADWVKEGAVVVDAGYHPGGVGDIELSALVDKASAYTPVPGGVGPMTINTLIMQSVVSAEKSLG